MSLANSSPWSAFELGLVTLEFESPFLTGAGEADHLHDAVFVADANGLPCIPGPTLAGVLRHALAGQGSPEAKAAADELFGYQRGQDGESSRIRIGFASVHGANDLPVPFRGANGSDSVLAFLKAGAIRDHVRLNAHGVADGRGKFDVLAVPAGARFSFEVMISKSAKHSLMDILSWLQASELRIGRHGRSGLGRFKLIRAVGASLDLSQPKDRQRLAKIPVALHQMATCGELQSLALPAPRTGQGSWAHAHITLQAIGTWVVGGGKAFGDEPGKEGDKEWGRLPLREKKVSWTPTPARDKGAVTADKDAHFVLPASAIKGALRHRSAFHARRLAGQWLEPSMQEVPSTEAEMVLFGAIRHGESGAAGRVHCADSQAAPNCPQVPFQHVSLDRFTQGPMDHLLFDELALGETTLSLQLDVRLDDSVDAIARQALMAAIQDLCHGRLSLGAGRGHGRFKGTVKWTGAPLLLEETACR